MYLDRCPRTIPAPVAPPKDRSNPAHVQGPRVKFPLLTRACILAVFGILLPALARGQVQGRVAGSSGKALDAVTVELWSASQRIAVVRTDPAGAFAFSRDEALNARSLTLTRLGYQGRSVLLRPGASTLSLVLEPLPVSLPELTVRQARRICPNREQPQARTLWEAVRSRYSRTTSGRGYEVQHLVAREHVSEDRIGLVDESRVVPTVSWSGALAQDVNASIAAQGYAVVQPSHWRLFDDDYFSWRYPKLHSATAHHFASDVFGARHDLSVVSSSPGETVLAFCPRNRRQPFMEGTLIVSADSTFAEAAWSFTTPKPKESAGGEVFFAPLPDDLGGPRPHLLAARGVFWRRLGGRDLFYQRAEVLLDWSISDDARPPPRRMQLP
jgi:hypothetical protein